MKEQEIIFKAISDLSKALPAAFDVRSRGGDESGKPPLCLLDWDSRRLNENGANPYAGLSVDQAGNAVGRELHRYSRMELDVVIRADSEDDRDTLVSDVVDWFLPYEYDASGFHEDTTEWEVGDPSPRSNPVVEPDWFEAGLTIRFKYVSRVEQEADALTSIQESVDGFD